MDEKTAQVLLADILTIDGKGREKKAQYMLYLVTEFNQAGLVKLLTNAAYGGKEASK